MFVKFLRLLSLCLIIISPHSIAGNGFQLGLSDSFISAGLYSIFSLDGEDLQGDAQSGFIHTQIDLKGDASNEAYLLDISAEVGRFILDDKRLAIAVGIRPLIGEAEESKNKKSTLADISIGLHIQGSSWISQSAKLNGSIAYFRSPEVTSFGDFDHADLFQVRLGFPIIASSEIFLSYLKVDGKLSSNQKQVTITDTAYLGIRIGF